MSEVTREQVQEWTEELVHNGKLSVVVGNRLIDILNEFPNVQSFMDAPEVNLLTAYRKISKSKKDLGKYTWNGHQALREKYCQYRRDKAQAEKDAANEAAAAAAKEKAENPTFTVGELKSLAAMMELAEWHTADLKKLAAIRDCFGFKLDK